MLNSEEEFDNFVRLFGGYKVTDIIEGSPNFKNADYVFDEFKVIAELKCLEEDKIKDKNIRDKASLIYNEYLHTGRSPILVFGTRRITTDGFPESFKEKIANLYKTPIQKRIAIANKQIRETKKELNKEDYTGLLILVNDNNTVLNPNHIMWSLSKILHDKNYSSIDQVLFLTINLKAQHPNIDKDLLVWIPANRPGFKRCSDDFMDKLKEQWFSYIQNRLNIPISVINIDDNQLIDNVINIPQKT